LNGGILSITQRRNFLMNSYSPLNREVGQRIRALRRAARLSQESLGDAIDASQAAISYAENGNANINSIFSIYDRLITSELAETRTPGGAYRVGRLKN
jgi:DNA-binding XRE family transcriptional regulator